MAIERNCRSNYECLVKIKGVASRPIPFSQMSGSPLWYRSQQLVVPRISCNWHR